MLHYSFTGGQPLPARNISGGMANGANPIAMIVPCNRLVGPHGRLTGYGAGLEVKRKLLELERARPPILPGVD